MTHDETLRAPAAKLDELRAQIEAAAQGARTRNILTLVLSVVSVLLIGFWLYYAHQQFSSQVTPELAATFGEKYVQEYLPTASKQVDASLKEQAPVVVSEGEKQLKALPARMESGFQERATHEMDARMPEMESRLYTSLKSGLTDAQSKAAQVTDGSDETRFRTVLEALADMYGKETIKSADELHEQYTRASGDLVGGLTVLAEAKELTPEQKSQRNLIRDFLVLARESDPSDAAPTTLPTSR